MPSPRTTSVPILFALPLLIFQTFVSTFIPAVGTYIGGRRPHPGDARRAGSWGRLTTVGFGDFAPTTDATKIFTIFYIFSGIALITAFLNQLLKRMAGRAAERAANK